MNSIKGHTLFILAAIYLVLHYMQAHGIGPELIRFYGKDLIFIPILILGISSTMTVFKMNSKIRIKELILTILVCIVSFEFVFPTFGMAFERDLADISCYIIGGLFYYILFLRSSDNHKNQLHTGT